MGALAGIAKMLVYVGSMAALEPELKFELTHEDELRAELARHSESRARSLGVGRALLKFALQRAGLIGSQDKLPALKIGELGRPSLELPAAGSGWDFNISHSHGLIALTLGRGAMGVDLELCNLKRLNPALLCKVLSYEERLACVALGREADEVSLQESCSESVSSAAFGAADASKGKRARCARTDFGREVLSHELLDVSASEVDSLQPSLGAPWAYLRAEPFGALGAIWRQGLWWTQQWTLRECAIKVLGQSIFAYEKLHLELKEAHLSGPKLPRGTIHCYAIKSEEEHHKLSLQGAAAPKGSVSSADSAAAEAVGAGAGAWFLLSVFVPEGESLELMLWTEGAWRAFALPSLAHYSVSAERSSAFS